MAEIKSGYKLTSKVYELIMRISFSKLRCWPFSANYAKISNYGFKFLSRNATSQWRVTQKMKSIIRQPKDEVTKTKFLLLNPWKIEKSCLILYLKDVWKFLVKPSQVAWDTWLSIFLPTQIPHAHLGSPD